VDSGLLTGGQTILLGPSLTNPSLGVVVYELLCPTSPKFDLSSALDLKLISVLVGVCSPAICRASYVPYLNHR